MKLTRLFTLIPLILLMAACGGGEETAGSSSDPQSSSGGDAPQGAVPIPQDEEASTGAGEAETTPATAEATATAEIQPTATQEPTIEPEPTSAPETGPADGGWGESGTGAQTACDHPYMPLRQGATWTYTDSMEGTLVWEITDVQGDLQEATATMQMNIPGEDFTLQYTWECSADGGLVSFDFGSQGLGQMDMEVEMQMTVEEGNGQFLPPEEDLEPGYTWDSLYNNTFIFTTDESGEEIEFTGDMANDQTSTILTTEPLTIAGITTAGLQIEQVSAIAMTMQFLDQSISDEIATSNLLELGRGIGIVRQTSTTDFGDTTMELQEWYIP